MGDNIEGYIPTWLEFFEICIDNRGWSIDDARFFSKDFNDPSTAIDAILKVSFTSSVL